MSIKILKPHHHTKLKIQKQPSKISSVSQHMYSLWSMLLSKTSLFKQLKIFIKYLFASLYVFMQTWFPLFVKLFTDSYARVMNRFLFWKLKICNTDGPSYWTISLNVKTKFDFTISFFNLIFDLNIIISIKNQNSIWKLNSIPKLKLKIKSQFKS